MAVNIGVNELPTLQQKLPVPESDRVRVDPCEHRKIKDPVDLARLVLFRSSPKRLELGTVGRPSRAFNR